MYIGIIKHLSQFLPLKTLDQMYKALVRSHLDYCDIIYHKPSQQNQPHLGVTLKGGSPMIIKKSTNLAISSLLHVHYVNYDKRKRKKRSFF